MEPWQRPVSAIDAVMGQSSLLKRFILATYFRNVMWCTRRTAAINSAARTAEMFTIYLVSMYASCALFVIWVAVGWLAGQWPMSNSPMMWLIGLSICWASDRVVRRAVSSYGEDELLELAGPYGSTRQIMIRWLQGLVLAPVRFAGAVRWSAATKVGT